jgi:hypothetical protein
VSTTNTIYTVVLRSSSAAWFLDSEPPLSLIDYPSTVGPVSLTFRTHYVNEGFASTVPRHLWVEAQGEGPSFKASIDAFWMAANSALNLISLSANAPIEELQPETAFDATSGHSERAYFQQFMLPDTGFPRQGRIIDADATIAFIGALHHNLHTKDLDQVLFAITFYRAALWHWVPGQELLSVSYLSQGIEALAPLAKARYASQTGMSDDQLAGHWGIDKGWTKLSTNGRRDRLQAAARLHVLFKGDTATHKRAREARNGFQHVTLPFVAARSAAAAARDMTAAYLREAILDLAGVDQATRDTLLGPLFTAPLAWFEPKRYLWGRITTNTDDLAAPELQYPHVLWTWSIKALSRQNERLKVEGSELVKEQVANGATLTIESIEVSGPVPQP